MVARGYFLSGRARDVGIVAAAGGRSAGAGAPSFKCPRSYAVFVQPSVASMADHSHGHDHDDHVDEATGLEQSLEELEFLRSACAAAQAGDSQKLARLIGSRRLEALRGDGTASGSTGYTPLHYAARAGHLECVKILLDAGADVHAVTASGRATPLHRAAHQGHVHIMRALLAAGAKPSAVDSDGMTPAHKAASEGWDAATAMLIEVAPDLAMVKDRRGRTPAEYAAARPAR